MILGVRAQPGILSGAQTPTIASGMTPTLHDDDEEWINAHPVSISYLPPERRAGRLVQDALPSRTGHRWA